MIFSDYDNSCCVEDDEVKLLSCLLAQEVKSV